jgi:uncharacterized protein involved in exopolysaccharide biosynthesis
VNNSSLNVANGDELSLRDIGRIIFDGRRWVIAFIVVTTIASSSWALLSTSIYRSAAVLVPVNADRTAGGASAALGNLGGLASLAGINIGSQNSKLEEALTVLRSREFIERFISDRNLLPELFPRKWDSRAQNWRVPASRVPTLWKGYKYFVKSILNIDADKKTGLVTVNIDWKDRSEAADWANEVVDRVNSEMRERALHDAVLSTQYLEKEREGTQFVETREAINRLIEGEIRQKMLASVTKEYVFRVVDRALPADIDDILRPKRWLFVLLGVIGGALAGSMIVLARFSLRKSSIENSSESSR